MVHQPVLRGSIPAQAGEPPFSILRLSVQWVYPRTGGGTRCLQAHVYHFTGLSPHRRGNQRRVLESFGYVGSIPAQAGEPVGATAGSVRSRVYPRTGGGTRTLQSSRQYSAGLSPHRRGNLDSADTMDECGGSIPAQAGEPLWHLGTFPISRVYPRTGGGTWMDDTLEQGCEGLSPHRRGNRHECKTHTTTRGSIPAQAGEPSAYDCESINIRVYPRTGGGTRCAHPARLTTRGLSPHRRGNQYLPSAEPQHPGSIPAQAGEPYESSLPLKMPGVYPRTGGGTPPSRSLANNEPGLSPHRRGNL